MRFQSADCDMALLGVWEVNKEMKKLFAKSFISIAVLSSLFVLPFLEARSQTESREAEITFEKRQIRLGGKTVTVEIADTDEKRARGLMFRESLLKDHGMLFIFDSERELSFWMKNTLIPLSIGYFDKDKKLLEVQEMSPAIIGEMFPRTYKSRKPAMYALEMEKGWFSKNGIKEGTTFSFVSAGKQK